MTTVASPCINLCQMDPATGWCQGCQRTIHEIATWGGLDDAAKRQVLLRLPERRASLPTAAAMPPATPRPA